MSSLRDTLQILADYTPNGVIYTDLLGRIILGNQTMLAALQMDPKAMINQLIWEVIPELPSSPEALESSAVLSIGGQEMVVWEKSVKQEESILGHIYVFEKSHTIQALEYELRRKSRKSEHQARYTFQDLISNSPQMEQLLSYAKRVARSDSTILIQGESGTGKELIAQAIHNSSRRKDGPFVPVNIAALPLTLLESELFGYEEGAFTGAKKGGRRGLFEEAHGGTIFLDEIGEAPLEFQVRLLRVLQERQVRPIAGLKLIPIDVRVMAATNRNLMVEVEERRFREDLYYRLSVLPLKMLNLRERADDIPLLIDEFTRRFSHGRFTTASSIMTSETLAHLCEYSWPGNIRQLMNVVEFLLNIREEHQLVGIKHLPGYFLLESPHKDQNLVQDSPNQDLLWILGRLHEHGSIGRLRLAELATREGLNLTQG